MNGLELFVRARKSSPLLRGIALGGHVDYEIMLQMMEVGFDDCICKPVIDFKALHHAIRDSQAMYANWAATSR